MNKLKIIIAVVLLEAIATGLQSCGFLMCGSGRPIAMKLIALKGSFSFLNEKGYWEALPLKGDSVGLRYDSVSISVYYESERAENTNSPSEQLFFAAPPLFACGKTKFKYPFAKEVTITSDQFYSDGYAAGTNLFPLTKNSAHFPDSIELDYRDAFIFALAPKTSGQEHRFTVRYMMSDSVFYETKLPPIKLR